MLGTNSAAGIPVALFTFGSAIAAFLIGRSSQRYGRRLGLAGGFIIGGLGGLGIIIAALGQHIPLLFVSLFIYGAGMASNLQARYAGTDLAKDDQKATAASLALVSTTVGAVLGPNLVSPMGTFAESIGVPTLAGPFIMSSLAFLVAGLIVLIFLRPDPLLVANVIRASIEKDWHDNGKERKHKRGNKKGIVIGIVVMVVAQLIMTAIMTMTPVHMGHHGHDLSQVGLVIGLHIGAMYFVSPLTGLMLDRLGRIFMVYVASATLIMAGVVAAFAPESSLIWMIVALVLLGLGWNFGLLTGTAMIVDDSEPSKSAKIQGSADVLVALSGAAGGGLSGIMVASTSYQLLSIVGALLALCVLPLIILSLESKTSLEDLDEKI